MGMFRKLPWGLGRVCCTSTRTWVQILRTQSRTQTLTFIIGVFPVEMGNKDTGSLETLWPTALEYTVAISETETMASKAEGRDQTLKLSSASVHACTCTYVTPTHISQMNKRILHEIKLHMSPYKVSATITFKESKSRIVVAPDQGT